MKIQVMFADVSVLTRFQTMKALLLTVWHFYAFERKTLTQNK